MKSVVGAENITEHLKVTDMMLWVQKMNNISNRAREIVHNEFVIENYNKL